jgi:hypothetical protein
MKKIIFALALLIISRLSIYTQERPLIFDTSAEFSYYPQSAFDIDEISLEPDLFNYNLQLSTGLKLFEKVNAYFNMEVNDPTMKKLINIAGTVSAKYFSIQFDYHKVSGNVLWFDSFYNKENNLNFNQTWTTVALMSPRFRINDGIIVNYLNGLLPATFFSFLGGFANTDIRLGLFWNHSIIPQFIDAYDDNLENQNKFFDKSFVSDAYGLRLFFVLDMMDFDYEGLYLFVNAVFDFSFVGAGKASKEVIEKINTSGIKFDKGEFKITYIRTRDKIGLGYRWEFYKKKHMNIVVGLDISLETFYVSDYSLDSYNLGPFVSFGITY